MWTRLNCTWQLKSAIHSQNIKPSMEYRMFNVHWWICVALDNPSINRFQINKVTGTFRLIQISNLKTRVTKSIRRKLGIIRLKTMFGLCLFACFWYFSDWAEGEFVICKPNLTKSWWRYLFRCDRKPRIFQWRHMNDWNHRQLECLFNSLFRLTTKEIGKFHISGHLWGEFSDPQWISLHKGSVMPCHYACVIHMIYMCASAYEIAMVEWTLTVMQHDGIYS